jgi:hypothetical protein
LVDSPGTSIAALSCESVRDALDRDAGYDGDKYESIVDFALIAFVSCRLGHARVTLVQAASWPRSNTLGRGDSPTASSLAAAAGSAENSARLPQFRQLAAHRPSRAGQRARR